MKEKKEDKNCIAHKHTQRSDENNKANEMIHLENFYSTYWIFYFPSLQSNS